MDNKTHVRWANKIRATILDLPFSQTYPEIVREVGINKDSRGKEYFGLMHRVRGHGSFSNIPYLFEYGIRGLRAGRIHDRHDLLWSLGNPSKPKVQTIRDLAHVIRERRLLRIRERRLIL